ncbi:MAG: hypothetical protein NUV34_06930, partial [Sulfuricaulis sp.]|nr:hypothetical protein [Sulfuricaulis sp.]
LNGISATELGYLDGVSVGVAASGKAVVLGATGAIATIPSGTFTALVASTARLGTLNATIVGNSTALAGSFTALVATSAHLTSLDATTVGAATAATGSFTALVATSAHLTSLDATTVGAATAATGAFTSLSASATAAIGATSATTIGLYGVTPTAQVSAIVTALTTGATSSAGVAVGYASTAQLQAHVDATNAIIVALRTIGVTL